jgi:eukaryotic-like serine/threonine-protein kinase
VEGELGRGGAGVVLRVREVDTGRELALKMLHGRLDERARTRFAREGQVTAGLRHPGIVALHSAGEDAGRPYLVYELVEGCRDLEGALVALPLRDQIRILRDVGRALGAAHAAGVIHRDVKPANLLLDARGGVRVADFGMALARDDERLTRTGAMVGTPSYMSPEQVRGERGETPATDVWALGVILHQALSGGALPFGGGSITELMAQIMHADLPALPDAPTCLVAVRDRALERDPSRRYPEGEAMAADLERWLAGRRTEAWVRRARRRWVLAGMLAPLVAIAVLVTGLTLRRQRRLRAADAQTPPPSVARAPAPSPEPEPPSGSPPAWIAELPESARPPWPLPDGLALGAAPRELICVQDESVLIWISPGKARLGTDAPEDDFDMQVEEVWFVRGFLLGKHEVTRAQYARFCALTGHEPAVAEVQGEVPGEDHPVVGVSLADARAYCAWAGLRLPTGEEWEYGARGSDGRLYPWGDELLAGEGPLRGNGSSPGDGFETTSPVGRFPAGASPWGCLDMAGNAWEWTETLLQGDVPLVDRDTASFAVRGGGWSNSIRSCRATRRYPFNLELRDERGGFRVARDP